MTERRIIIATTVNDDELDKDTLADAMPSWADDTTVWEFADFWQDVNDGVITAHADKTARFTTDLVKAFDEPPAKHDIRPDDLPEPGDRCKTCGKPIVWIGPSTISDWIHTDDEENQ